jgi:hypothetical protein
LIDQPAQARQARLELRDTKLLIFENPTAGTPVMATSRGRVLGAQMLVPRPEASYRFRTSSCGPQTTPDVVRPCRATASHVTAATRAAPVIRNAALLGVFISGRSRPMTPLVAVPPPLLPEDLLFGGPRAATAAARAKTEGRPWTAS